jgi:glyoxylase-like metal-dependent hydrolase (beta-lactamase superfamily II)
MTMTSDDFAKRDLESPPDVEILLKGYYTLDESGGRVCSTVTLVQDNDLNIIVDPGTLSSPQVLFQELNKRNLVPDDIDIVFITHSHIDHFKNVGLFTRARILDYWGWWDGDLWSKADGIINSNIQVLNTPGHSYDSITLQVKTGEGVIAICGDVFWDKDFPKYPRDDPYAQDAALLEESRKKLVGTADYIIPGHGDRFHVSMAHICNK